MIAEARKYGMKLVLSLVDNYENFGGKKQYVEWARSQGGQSIYSEDDFFTNPVVKGYYKNHIKASIFILFSFEYSLILSCRRKKRNLCSNMAEDPDRKL